MVEIIGWKSCHKDIYTISKIANGKGLELYMLTGLGENVQIKS